MITNFCLLNDIQSAGDRFCITVRVRRNEKNLLILEVRNDDPAPYINYKQHASEFNILHIREKKYPDLFLLSGGLLIFEKNSFSLALGKRNRNSVDPLCWTNIATGRCETYWDTHLKQELAEEFLLYFHENRDSYVSLIPEILDDPATVFKNQQKVFSRLTSHKPLAFPMNETGDFLELNRKPFWKTIQIYWPNHLDEFEAIMYFDAGNNTFELRQPALVDLTLYQDLNLLYPEGDLEAGWFPVSELKHQRQKELLDDKQRFVPFLQYFLDHM